LGVVGLAAIVAIVIKYPTPTDSQSKVFWTVMALAGAAFAMALTGFISVRLSLPGAGRLVAGGSLAVFGVIYFVSPASPVSAPKNSSSPEKRELTPGDVAGVQGAFVILDEQVRTFLDRARDLKDAYTYVGREAFVHKEAQARLNDAIHRYNPAREELAKNHERYVIAINQQGADGSALGSQVDVLLDQIESLHKDCVLPLNELGKAMDKLGSKRGPEIERQRTDQTAKLTALMSTLDVRLSGAEAALKAIEQSSKASH
jgi:hypothetical protein